MRRAIALSAGGLGIFLLALLAFRLGVHGRPDPESPSTTARSASEMAKGPASPPPAESGELERHEGLEAAPPRKVKETVGPGSATTAAPVDADAEWARFPRNRRGLVDLLQLSPDGTLVHLWRNTDCNPRDQYVPRADRVGLADIVAAHSPSYRKARDGRRTTAESELRSLAEARAIPALEFRGVDVAQMAAFARNLGKIGLKKSETELAALIQLAPSYWRGSENLDVFYHTLDGFFGARSSALRLAAAAIAQEQLELQQYSASIIGYFELLGCLTPEEGLSLLQRVARH